MDRDFVCFSRVAGSGTGGIPRSLREFRSPRESMSFRFIGCVHTGSAANRHFHRSGSGPCGLWGSGDTKLRARHGARCVGTFPRHPVEDLRRDLSTGETASAFKVVSLGNPEDLLASAAVCAVSYLVKPIYESDGAGRGCQHVCRCAACGGGTDDRCYREQTGQRHL